MFATSKRPIEDFRRAFALFGLASLLGLAISFDFTRVHADEVAVKKTVETSEPSADASAAPNQPGEPTSAESEPTATEAEPTATEAESSEPILEKPQSESQVTLDPTELINRRISSRWEETQATVSPRCDDQTFVRRIYLDLIGRIPTVAERNEFLEVQEPEKRAKLVDRLLSSSEFGQNMADIFDATLMGRTDARKMERRRPWRSYLAESFNANRPWNVMAKEMLLARKTEESDIRAGWFLYERKNDHQAIAEAVAPNFFGIRIECAQCHDHPLCSEIAQAHYWGLVAFFNRGKNENTSVGPRVVESAIGGFGKFTDLSGDSHDALLTFFESPQVDEARPNGEQKEADEFYVPASLKDEPRVPTFSRRQRFVEDVVTTHPMLAKAFVNRMWAILLGRGIVHPINEIDSMHPASHPELLEELADDFRKSNFDVKRLVRHIVAADCYHLDSRPAGDVKRQDLFTFAIERTLTAENLIKSLFVVTQGGTAEPDADSLADFRRKFPDVLAEAPISEAAQALYLTNNPGFQKLVYENSPSVQTLATEKDLGRRVDKAFEIVFGRDATGDEVSFAKAFLGKAEDTSNTDSVKPTADLLWAMLTSAEFRFNH